MCLGHFLPSFPPSVVGVKAFPSPFLSLFVRCITSSDDHREGEREREMLSGLGRIKKRGRPDFVREMEKVHFVADALLALAGTLLKHSRCSRKKLERKKDFAAPR